MSKERQTEILQAIKDYVGVHGYPPTVQEIGDVVGLKSKNSVWQYLQQMIDAGILETDHPGCPRAIRVPEWR